MKHKLLLLGASTCPKCQMVKDFLDKNNIEYKYELAYENDNMKKYKFLSIPTLIILDENNEEIDRAVNKETSLIKKIKEYNTGEK